MRHPSVRLLMLAAVLIGAPADCGPSAARADHTCDPIGDEGWTLVPTHETTGVVDSAPYRAGGGGDWFVDRTTTLLPLCNYFNAVGNYSLRSYSLSPQAKTERVAICRGDTQGVSVAIPPHAGPCPLQ